MNEDNKDFDVLPPETDAQITPEGADKVTEPPVSDETDRFTTQDISDIDHILDEQEKDGSKPKIILTDSADTPETEAGADERSAEQPQAEETPASETAKESHSVKDGLTALREKFTSKDQKETVGSKDAQKPRSKGLPKKETKKTPNKTWIIVLSIIAGLALIGGIGIYLLYTANFTDISGVEYTPKEKTAIYTADNVQIASIYSQNRTYVSINQVPQDLKNALVATEDSRFYTHHGVDYFGVLRALVSNVVGGNSRGQGASTLTQQLARLLYLPDIASESTFMDSLNRKFKEISIAYQLEDKYTKDQIMEMYLNEYYFGSAAYGIESAAETYFGKHVSDLNLAESAMLAGLPQAPSVYAPNSDFEAAKNRQRQVLDRMVDAGYIDQAQADEAYNTPLNIVPWSPNDINNQISPGYQDFVNQVLNEYAVAVSPTVMKERGLSQDEAIAYTRENVASGGYKFYTTLYASYQNDAIETVQNKLSGYGYDQAAGYTAALVTCDRDGAIRAYYGGNEAYSDIDMADSPRQPGSNIKPLYYAMALEKGLYSPGSTLMDEPINIGGYSPQNYGNSYSGAITFTQSLVQSKNVTSVQIFDDLGVTNAVDGLKQYGFTTINDDDYNLAVALGGLTNGFKPYEMAAAFNTFNNGGVYNQPYFIQKATTSAGEQILDKSNLGLVSRQVMSADTASTMWNIMRQVVTSGTGGNAACGRPTAGKTGTTDNEENLWFTGMTGNLTTSVWMGNLDYEIVGGGSYLPAGIYGSYMSTLVNNDMIAEYNPEWTPVTKDAAETYQAPQASDETSSAEHAVGEEQADQAQVEDDAIVDETEAQE